MQPSSFRKERGSLPTDTKRTAMTTENPFPWADGMNCAVTVCDTEGVILYMNEKARATYIRHGNLIGSNLFGCHNERSREIIRRLTAEGGSNAYTIETGSPQDDLSDGLTDRGQGRRSGGDFDGNTRRDAALHPGLRASGPRVPDDLRRYIAGMKLTACPPPGAIATSSVSADETSRSEMV